MRTARPLGLFLVLGTLGAAASGCSGKTETTSQGPIGTVRATLRKATSCADLEQSLKADALHKMNKAIDAQIRFVDKYGSGGGIAYSNGGPGALPTPTVASGAPERAGGEQAVDDKASSYSETNKQVDGVDEADFVKTDGKYIYLLHGQKLEILNAWPANSLSEATNVDIEGEPTEMFQWDGKIVVYSRVDGSPIYSASGVSPRPAYQDYVYGGARVAIAPGPGGGYYPGWVQNPLTKITVIDIQGTSPSVSREVYFEGNYLSSRRIDGQVRSVLQGPAPGPQLKTYPEAQPPSTTNEVLLKQYWISAYEQLRSENTAIIQSSKVTDWVPYTFAKTAAGVQASSLACEDFYLPTPGTTQYGLTHVQTFDANSASSLVKTAAIIGQADTVYSSEKTMVLAARAWIEPEIYEAIYELAGGGSSSSGSATVGSGTVEASPPTPAAPPQPSPDVGTRNLRPLSTPTQLGATPVTMSYTHLHKFDIATDPSSSLYVASGTVAGNIKDQFSIDERAGIVRVSTTEQRSYVIPQGVTVDWSTLPRTSNHVFALEEQSGDLKTIGSVRDLAPGESVMSTRFVGDTGYVVTFLQKDPLFVVDLKDPRALVVRGQLTIPGFSSYMHPLGDTHLLTIGRDEGLALQIFDVSDPGNPKQAHKYVFTDTYGGYSEAENNHKAFTYFADKKLLAFPFVGYGDSSMKSTLELFKIDAQAGIERVGAVDHSSFFGTISSANRGYCGGYFAPTVRRGIFLDNVVYSVSYGGILANDSATLSQIASFSLPQPQLDAYAGCDTGGAPGMEK